ncbi:hypothetical protein [Azospirillum baldaniorum]|nr:hypothetical protein [Azospirillum baldaniorum]
MPDEDSVITKPTQLASTEPTDAEVEALDDGDDEGGDEDQGGSEPDDDV